MGNILPEQVPRTEILQGNFSQAVLMGPLHQNGGSFALAGNCGLRAGVAS